MSTSRDSALLSGSHSEGREDYGWRRRRRPSRRLVATLAAAVLAAGIGVAAVELGTSSQSSPGHAATASRAAATAVKPLNPETGENAQNAAGGATAAHSAKGAGAGTAQGTAEVRDPEEAKSFPVSPEVRARYGNAATPSKASAAFVAPGALSTSQVRQDLSHLQALERASQASVNTVEGGDSVGGNGTIPIPSDVPVVVQKVIAGANEIADLPYVYGGGHASFVDNAYDCSGSISYALAAGGLLSAPETSGELESWGAPGPGQWITVYANAGHVFMYVNVGGAWMRYDTVGRSGPFASRWQPDKGPETDAFVVRHWPGL